MKKNIKIVIFDVDDTLIYTINTAYKKTNLAGKNTYNMDLSKDKFLELYGKYSFEDCIRRLYNKEEINDFIENYNNIKMDYQYIADIDEVVRNLRKERIIVGIVTNSTLQKTNRKLNKYIDLFDFVYTDAHKPDPKIFLEIIDKYNVKNTEVLYIGDSQNDYLASQNANINFCAVNTGKEKWNKENVTTVMESINDLL